MKCNHTLTTSTRRTRKSGFTLIEMLLVVAIIGTLAALIVPKIAGRGNDAKIAAAKADISTLGTALDAFQLDNDHYPNGKNGLADLITLPRDASNWKGPYLKDMNTIPLDPWGHAYVYEFPGKHTVNGYDLTSMGPDGQLGTADDIANYKR